MLTWKGKYHMAPIVELQAPKCNAACREKSLLQEEPPQLITQYQVIRPELT